MCSNFWKGIRDSWDKSFVEVLATGNSERELDNSKKNYKKILLPGSSFRKSWDSFIVFTILFTCKLIYNLFKSLKLLLSHFKFLLT